jgi:hypothetical protein
MTDWIGGFHREDCLHVMARDPSWVFAYWQVSPVKIEGLIDRFGGGRFEASTWELRILRLEDGEYHEIEVEGPSGNWYIQVEPESSYHIELGLRLSDGNFHTILKTPRVTMPPMGISEEVDPDWPVSDETYYRLVSPLEFSGLSSTLHARAGSEAELAWTESHWPLSPTASSTEVQKAPRGR